MARKTTPLSATEVQNAKATGKEYSLSDGHGLQLRISPSGSKRWLLNFSKPGTKKRSNLGLGKYPDLSLANARKLAAEAKERLALGVDPVDHKRELEQQRRRESVSTLKAIGEEWLKVKRSQVSAEQADKLWRRMELHILPSLGNRPLTKLTRQEVIHVLRPIEAGGRLETVKRLCQVLNQIMTFAANTGYVDANNLYGINKAFETPQPQNMPTLPPERLPDLMKALYGGSISKQTRLLIELQLHTLTRPNEVAGARWEEVDLERALWIIPANRMKMKREHKIPLSSQSLEIFSEMHAISGHRQFVFPKRGDPLSHASTQTANQAIKRMGFHGELVSHGLRSLASTILNEQGIDPDIIEASLAHVDRNDVRAAYNRAEYLERRRKMMTWWSEHVRQALHLPSPMNNDIKENSREK